MIYKTFKSNPNGTFSFQIESHLVLLKLLPVGSLGHMHVVDVLKAVDEFGHVATANGQANNGCETKSITTASPSTSVAPLIRSRGQHATTSPSTSVAPIIRGCGRSATTPQVVTSPEILAPILHASLQPEVPPYVSLILAPNRSKLSKWHGATSVGQVVNLYCLNLSFMQKLGYKVFLCSPFWLLAFSC